MTKTKIILLAVLLTLVAAAVCVKLFFFPPLKDEWFEMNPGRLQQVPAGFAAIRPTHFPMSVLRKGVMYSGPKGRIHARWMGRNVSLRDIIAVAYGENVGRVVMPSLAPTNHFDFLLTENSDPRVHLQKAIRRQFGYIAQKETKDTDVLAIKVENPELPGLTVSSPGEKEGGNFKNGKLYINHLQIKELTGGFEQLLKTPVVDKTGLTNYYDLSLEWNRRLFMQMQNDATARAAADKILGAWGLGLEPDAAPLEVLVVKRAE